MFLKQRMYHFFLSTSSTSDRHSMFINNLIRCFSFEERFFVVWWQNIRWRRETGGGIRINSFKWFRYGGYILKRSEIDVCMKPFQIDGRNNLAQSPHAGKNIYDNQKVSTLQYSFWSQEEIHFCRIFRNGFMLEDDLKDFLMVATEITF